MGHGVDCWKNGRIYSRIEAMKNDTIYKLSVVIPCYNEEESIQKVIKSIPKGVFEIIVVDNNSTDMSAEIAKQNGARVIVETTQGYGAALRAGFNSARSELIAALDADFQYPAEELPSMLDFMESRELDFISATRFPLVDKTSMGPVRRVGNWGLTVSANFLLGLTLTDSQSGMWLFKRDTLEHILPDNDDMPFSQELKIKAARHPNIRFAEFHVSYRPRIGTSKLVPFRHGLILLRHLAKMRFKDLTA